MLQLGKHLCYWACGPLFLRQCLLGNAVNLRLDAKEGSAEGCAVCIALRFRSWHVSFDCIMPAVASCSQD